MHLFKRITTTINSSVEDVVSRLENHDAIVEASIRECRQAAARTRVRLARVKRDGEQLRNMRVKTARDIALWTDRAAGSVDSDENKALQCVKRKQQSETALRNLDASIQQHQQAERKLQDSLTHIEKRILEISQQRNTMRSRQSAAEAVRIINRLEGDSDSSVEETFERWESSLLESEIARDYETRYDSLESEYLEQEELDDLKEELQKLVQNREGQKND